jgi:carbamoylphosphate synthase large subunit
VLCGSGVRAVFPTRDDELPALSDLTGDARVPRDCILVVSDREFIEICDDKLRTFATFSEAGIPVAHTWLPGEDPPERLHLTGDSLVFVKPRRGAASAGIKRVAVKHVKHASAQIAEPIVQEDLGRKEVSVDALFSLDGEPVHFTCRTRDVIAGGQSVVSTIVDARPFGVVVEKILAICSRIGAKGIINIQVFEREGEIVLGEINARLGSGYPLTQAGGGCYSEWLLAAALGRELPEIDVVFGLRMARGSQDVFWTP